MQLFIDTITKLKHTIQTHRVDLANNEALTRYALVDVLLNSLGWDVHNPVLVIPEYSKGMNGGRADYALLNANNKPVAIIEAKKFGQVNSQDLIQVTNYAFHSGIKYSLATDGNTWIVADAFKQVSYSEKEIMRFVIDTDAINVLLIKFACLLPENLFAGEQAVFPDFHSVHISQYLDLKQPTSVVNSQTSIVLKPRKTPKLLDQNLTEQKKWVSFNSMSGNVTIPLTLKFPDGTSISVKTYSAILKQVTEWLVKTQKLPNLPLKDASSGVRYLLSNTPYHKDGRAFAAKSALPNGTWLETNYSASDCIKNTLWLLKQAGEKLDNFYFQQEA